MITYKASGMVLGNCWGGSYGGYPARKLSGDNLIELCDEIKAGLADGSLDSGMGYESLIGAVMNIETIDTREIDGKTFVATERETEFFGDLTEEQEDFLTEAMFYD